MELKDCSRSRLEGMLRSGINSEMVGLQDRNMVAHSMKLYTLNQQSPVSVTTLSETMVIPIHVSAILQYKTKV